MKKTVSAGLGGRNFIMDEDAYIRLTAYLEAYAQTIKENRKEVMEEVEQRIADLFREKRGIEVVNLEMVDDIARQMGFPEYKEDPAKGQYAPGSNSGSSYAEAKPVHKFFRDVDDRKIGGVCSGLAAYFDVDVTLMRILFVVLLFCGSAGFWIYIIVCIVSPTAYSAVEKCQLRGLPCTVENIQRFTNSRR